MPTAAATALTKLQSPSRAARELAALTERVERPSAALVFATGALGPQLHALADAIAAHGSRVPTLVVSGAAVMSQGTEVEGGTGAAIMVWSGGSPELACVGQDNAEDLEEALADAVERQARAVSPGIILFARADHLGPTSLEGLRRTPVAQHLFGASATGAPGIVALDESGRRRRCNAAALVLHGLPPPIIQASPAARLLTPLMPITSARGALVTRIGGEDALAMLGSAGQGLPGEPLLMAALSDRPGSAGAGHGRPELLLRPIQGIDPVRHGVLVSDEVEEGLLMAFAARDALAARADLDAVARGVNRLLAGAVPRFGLYLRCASRGALFDGPELEARLLRAALPDVPLAGLASSFEIAPHAGQPRVHLLSGVLAVFGAPS